MCTCPKRLSVHIVLGCPCSSNGRQLNHHACSASWLFRQMDAAMILLVAWIFPVLFCNSCSIFLGGLPQQIDNKIRSIKLYLLILFTLCRSNWTLIVKDLCWLPGINVSSFFYFHSNIKHHSIVSTFQQLLHWFPQNVRYTFQFAQRTISSNFVQKLPINKLIFHWFGFGFGTPAKEKTPWMVITENANHHWCSNLLSRGKIDLLPEIGLIEPPISAK